MSTTLASPSLRTKVAPPLPAGLLAKMASAGRLALMLDYDGTLAEIASDPARAVPIPGVAETIERLARASASINLAIVSGRRVAEVRSLLGVRAELFFSGVHGLEFADGDGEPVFVTEARACEAETASVRRWLRANVPAGRGFWVEDKEITLGLHYRNVPAEDVQPLRERFAGFVGSQTPNLKLMRLKKIDEAMPKTAGKGHAVTTWLQQLPDARAAVYVGDDVTDEDAFAALRGGDVGILVGDARESLARYRLSGPRAVAKELRALASSIDRLAD
jgi:trehalose-phosphatase